MRNPSYIYYSSSCRIVYILYQLIKSGLCVECLTIRDIASRLNIRPTVVSYMIKTIREFMPNLIRMERNNLGRPCYVIDKGYIARNSRELCRLASDCENVLRIYSESIDFVRRIATMVR